MILSVVSGALGAIVQPPRLGAVFWIVFTSELLLPLTAPSFDVTVQVMVSPR